MEADRDDMDVCDTVLPLSPSASFEEHLVQRYGDGTTHPFKTSGSSLTTPLLSNSQTGIAPPSSPSMPRVRKYSFSSILTSPNDLEREDKSISDLFTSTCENSPRNAAGATTMPTRYGTTTLPSDAFVIVEYTPPVEGATPNHCRASVSMDMRFSTVVAHVSKNMHRQALVSDKDKLRFTLVEFRTVTPPKKPSATEHVVWIRASTTPRQPFSPPTLELCT